MEKPITKTFLVVVKIHRITEPLSKSRLKEITKCIKNLMTDWNVGTIDCYYNPMKIKELK